MGKKKDIPTYPAANLLSKLHQFSLKLGETERREEIFHEVVECLGSVYPSMRIIISELAPALKVYKIQALRGIETHRKKIEALLGKDILSVTFPLDAMHVDDFQLNSSGRLTWIKGGIFQLALHRIPRETCRAVEKILGISKVYTLGMELDHSHFGNIILLMGETEELNDKDICFIETASSIASTALGIFERKRIEKELIESEERYKKLLENAPLAIMIHRKGIIEYVNQTAVKLIQAESADELIGSSAMDLIHPDDRLKALERISHMYKTGEPAPVAEERLLTKNNQEIVLQIAAALIQYKDEPASMVFGLDVTGLKKAEEEISRYSRELEEINMTKDKFFSIIAHDLKGPFNSILGFADILHTEYDDYSDEERKHFIRNIVSSSQNTYRLLENLLEWSRTQTNRLDFNQGVLELSSLINDTILLLRGQAEAKEIHLFSAVEYDTRVFADENMVKTITRNLLTNAIKFSNRNGNIRVMERPTVDPGSGKDMVEILVKDDGIGMSPEVKEQLFRIDQLIKTPGTENEKGTGLGLLLSKELVTRHGGKIWAESDPGKGSIFHFTLPRA